MRLARAARHGFSRLRPRSMVRFLASVVRWLGSSVRLMGRAIRRDVSRLPSRRQVLTAGLALLMLAITVGGLLQLRFDTRTETFLPRDSPAMNAVQDKARGFGGDPIVVILESAQPGQLISNQKQLYSLIGLEGNLGKLPDVATVHGPGTVLNQVAGSAQGLLAQISGRRDTLRNAAEAEAKNQGQSAEQAKQAGREAVADFDKRYLPLIAKGLPAGLPTLRNSNFANTVVYDGSGNPRQQWHFVVPDKKSVSIMIRPRADLDQAGMQRLVESVRAQVNGANLNTSNVTITGIPVVTAGVAEDVKHEFPLLAALVAVAVALRFALVPSKMRWKHRLWPFGAALIGTALTVAVFGWLRYPLSFGAAALLPLLLGIGSSFPLYVAALPNLRRALVMSGASAVGFAALALSPLPFVAELGLALACGVLLTVATALVIRMLVGRPQTLDGDLVPARPDPAPERTQRAVSEQTGGWRRTVLRGAVAVSGAALAVSGWVALPSLSLQSDPQQLAEGADEIESARHAEEKLGSSGEISVVLRGQNVLSPWALDWQRQAKQNIISDYGDQARPVLSPPDLLGFLGDDPTAEQINAATQLMPNYLLSAVTRSDRTEAIVTFGVKLRDLTAQGRLIDGMRSALPATPPGYEAEIVGTPVAVDEGYHLISNDRYMANMAGIVVAGVVLLVGLRRRKDAVLAMFAALLATGWGFGAMWLLGIPLSPLTVALGALTTVTGCEFVVLLSEARYRRNAWLRRSVAFVCLTSVIGYLALTASKLWILREFGLVLTGAVLLSYLAAQLAVRFSVIPPKLSPRKRNPRYKEAPVENEREHAERRVPV